MYMKFYYSSDLHRGIAQYSLEAGWSLNTSMYRSGHMPNRSWDGVIGSFEEDDELYNTILKPKRVPAVSLTETKLMPSVLPDNATIGRLGAEHLLELGYKNFAFYFWQSKSHELQRAEAFQERLIPKYHSFFKINSTSKPRSRRQRMLARLSVLKRQLQRLPKPVAIMAPLDDLAVEIVDACVDLGLRIPADVGVLGVNNDQLLCDFAPTPISSIDDNEFKIGYEGAALLDRLMKGEPLSKEIHRIQPLGVVVRRSTDLLEIGKVPDRHVAIAVRFIAEHFQKSITTENVALAAGVSKRSLQERFGRAMNRSVHEQIMWKRIEHAKQLLRSTSQKTAAIAEVCGFGSRERFSKAFKQATGTGPLTYKKENSLRRSGV